MTQTRPVSWPAKTREIHNHHMDSTIWNNFEFRDGDIIIATWAKSGTTWTQQIVSQLIFNGVEGLNIPEISPWLDLRIMPPEAIAAVRQQKHRRFLKTHLPADAMVISPKAKYIYVARDGRDAAWSAYNHLVNFRPETFEMFNKAPGRVGPELPAPGPSVERFYRDWFQRDGYPLWSFWENIRSWWSIRQLPNVMIIHFNDLRQDLPGSIRQIAAFLGIAIDETSFPLIVEHCSFDYMKRHAHLSAPLGGTIWEGGAQTFINKGTNGRWQATLRPADVRAYDARAIAELGPDCAAWLEMGRGLRAAA